MMEFCKLDLDTHDVSVVSNLIFETEPAIFSLFFGKKKKAVKRIKKLVEIGGTSFGHEVVRLVVDQNDILGLTIVYSGGMIDDVVEGERFSEVLGVFGLFRLWFIDKVVIGRLLTQRVTNDELYVSNVCVRERSRGKGVGLFLMQEIIAYARLLGCVRMVLDVDKKNHGAIHLYKKVGFEVVRERRSWLWNVAILQMSMDI